MAVITGVCAFTHAPACLSRKNGALEPPLQMKPLFVPRLSGDYPRGCCVRAGLSVLELYLLIAMKRLEEKERDKYNFQTVFAGGPPVLPSSPKVLLRSSPIC